MDNVVVRLRGPRVVFVLVFIVPLTLSVVRFRDTCPSRHQALSDSLAFGLLFNPAAVVLADDFAGLLQQTLRHRQSQLLRYFIVNQQNRFR